MSTATVNRRLERIESALAPSKKPVLFLIVSTPGMPDEVYQAAAFEPTRGKRGFQEERR